MDDTANALFAGPGEMRARCREFDWASTPLGPVANWPQSLRIAVDLCLGSAASSVVRTEAGLRASEAAMDVERGAQERGSLGRALAEAEEAERRRLARELHDQLGQELTAFRLGLEEALRLAAASHGPNAPSSASLSTRLTSLLTMANHMAIVARSIAVDLRPLELDDMGLASAIETYVHSWSSRYGITTEIAMTGMDNCSKESDAISAVYRILQEALTNVAKHAAASHVSVIGGCSNGEIRLVVEDNGRGFDMTAPPRVGSGRRLGVAGMQERAALMRGSVSVESIPDVGTTVYVRIPMGTPPPSSI
jgi:signal transduction histidine kinase